MSHLTAEEIARLRTGTASPADYRRAVRHLLAGCPQCALALGPLEDAGHRATDYDHVRASDYDSVIEAFERRLRALLEEAVSEERKL
jgi:hypothetical protein